MSVEDVSDAGLLDQVAGMDDDQDRYDLLTELIGRE